MKPGRLPALALRAEDDLSAYAPYQKEFTMWLNQLSKRWLARPQAAQQRGLQPTSVRPRGARRRLRRQRRRRLGRPRFVAGQGFAAPNGIVQPGQCAINCTNQREVYSFHPGGANVLMADGSVRFLKESIDIRVFAGLVTRAGGEVPGDF